MKGFKKILSFCIAGTIGALIELASFNLFFLFLAFPLSKLLALTVALSVNFTLNRNITFSASSEKKRKQIPRYVFVYSIAILANYFSSILANSILGPGVLNANIATVIGILVGLPITFLGSLFWIFKKPKTPAQ
jgi:putative flippase GtrA